MVFRSIIRAEPANAAPVLLPRCMQRLLYNAFSGVVPTVYTSVVNEAKLPAGTPAVPVHERCRVHALNIMKLLFQDSSLGGALEHYVSPALHAAIVGFKSSSWAVRNSSMMVFAMVTSRCVCSTLGVIIWGLGQG